MLYRVLVLGDSHAFGWGVEFEEIFPKVLEQKLNSVATKFRYEVINTRTMGYGTGHQYEFLKVYGSQFKPDLVLVTMDFLHDLEVNNVYFAPRNNGLTRTCQNCPFARTRIFMQYVPFSGFFRERSYLFKFLGLRFRFVSTEISPVVSGRALNPGNTKYDLETTKEIVNQLSEEVGNQDTNLAFVLLPELRSYDRKMLRSFEDF